MKRQRLVVFDGNAIVHRAYHALPPMTTREGELVNAVYGYSSILLKVLAELKPDYVAVAFDMAGPTFRHEEYAEYKATRVKGPDDLYLQFSRVKEVTQALSMPIFEKEGYEADDLIGCLSTQAPDNVETIIVTGDLDELQLVNHKTKVYTMRRGFSDTVIYDEKAVEEKYGFSVDKFVDYKALRGDPSDNIPGVAGIGDKTATALIIKYGSIENVYKNLDGITGNLKQKLDEGRENAYLSKSLSTIRCDESVKLNLEDCITHNFDRQIVFELFRDLGFKSLLNKLPQNNVQVDLFGENVPREPKHVETAKYKVIDSEEELDKMVEAISKRELLAVDTETNSQISMQAKLVGVSLSAVEGEAYYIPVGHIKGKQIPLERVKEKIGPILASNEIKKIGHNLKYDYIVLKRAGFDLSGIHFDTMIAAYLLNQNLRSPKLSDIAFSELGLEMVKIEEIIGGGKSQTTFDRVEIEESYKYACEDADVSLRLFLHMREELHEKKFDNLFYEIEMKLVDVLADIEMAGVMIDSKAFSDMSVDFANRISDLETTIYKLAGEKFNINSPSQLQVILFEKLNLQDIIEDKRELKKVKSGGYSTGANELEKIRGAHSIVDKISEYRELSKLKSTYVDTLPELVNKETLRIHTSFNQAITATGRLSSSDPNLQNIPIRTEEGRQIRKAFVAKKGSKLISIDYSQIELRIIAHLSGDKVMTETFKRGEDIHAATAAKVYGVKEDRVTSEMRRNAKAVNFGIIYGVSAHGLKQSTGMSREEAQDFIDKYYEIHQGIRKYLDNILVVARKKGYVETLFGRRRYLPEINSSNAIIRNQAERMALNMPIQGTAADIMKVAMIKIAEKLPDVSKGTLMILQVHDELVFEAPDKDVEKVAKMAKEEMDSVIELSVPITAEVGIGDNWGDCK